MYSINFQNRDEMNTKKFYQKFLKGHFWNTQYLGQFLRKNSTLEFLAPDSAVMVLPVLRVQNFKQYHPFQISKDWKHNILCVQLPAGSFSAASPGSTLLMFSSIVEGKHQLVAFEMTIHRTVNGVISMKWLTQFGIIGEISFNCRTFKCSHLKYFAKSFSKVHFSSY